MKKILPLSIAIVLIVIVMFFIVIQDNLVKKEDREDKKIPAVEIEGAGSNYVIFTQENYEKALADNKTIVLYFYANWCPICKNEQTEIAEAFDELKNLNIVGFRVNYKDSETEKEEEALAKEFGVSYQHTKIIIKDGKQVLKSPDSWSKERYLEQLQNS